MHLLLPVSTVNIPTPTAFLEDKINPENSSAVTKAIEFYDSCTSASERSKSATLVKQMLISRGLSFPLIDSKWHDADLLKLVASMNRFEVPGRIFCLKPRNEDGSRQQSLVQVSDVSQASLALFH